MRNRKGMANDFVLNLLASIISTGVLQLILYPFLARMVSVEEYGVLLTIMGVGNTIVAALAGSLNNTRLLQNNLYEVKNYKGDFEIILIASLILSAISFTIYLLFLDISIITKVLLVSFTILASARSYGCVTFRLIINYKKNLVMNIIVGAGTLFGLFIFSLINNTLWWPLPFIVGEGFGVIMLLKVSSILYEEISITKHFKDTISKQAILFITTLISNLLIYLDRILLLPILGATAVSIYSVASFFGKSLGVVMAPMAGVLLGYYAQSNYIMTRSKFWKTNLITAFLSVLFFAFCLIFASWGTGLFYPTMVGQASPYLIMANLAAILNIMANMTQPAVLKFAPTFWQLLIQAIYSVIYLVAGIFMAQSYGLYGFCFAAIVAAVIKLITLYFIGHFYIGGRTIEE